MAATQATAKGTHGQVRTAADLQQGASIRLYRVSGGAENAIECIKTMPEHVVVDQAMPQPSLTATAGPPPTWPLNLADTRNPDPFTTTSNYAVQPAAPEWMHNGRYAQAPRTVGSALSPLSRYLF
ncbi:hypothetical protein JCM10049v2_007775 [Rhodotorula toruloides]